MKAKPKRGRAPRKPATVPSYAFAMPDRVVYTQARLDQLLTEQRALLESEYQGRLKAALAANDKDIINEYLRKHPADVDRSDEWRAVVDHWRGTALRLLAIIENLTINRKIEEPL